LEDDKHVETILLLSKEKFTAKNI
jgi:hypothetical protein